MTTQSLQFKEMNMNSLNYNPNLYKSKKCIWTSCLTLTISSIQSKKWLWTAICKAISPIQTKKIINLNTDITTQLYLYNTQFLNSHTGETTINYLSHITDARGDYYQLLFSHNRRNLPIHTFKVILRNANRNLQWNQNLHPEARG